MAGMESAAASAAARAASDAGQAQAVLQELTFTVRELWSERPRGVPPWVLQLLRLASVERVLRLAGQVCDELGARPGAVAAVAPVELAVYWAVVLREHYDQELPRNPVDVAQVEVAVARRVATAVFAMHQQSTRYVNFLRFGPPPGVRQFPEYVGSERTKALAVPWDWRRTAAQPDRAVQYQACTTSQPRRVPSLRSRQCAPSDVDFPSFYT